jgi:hypothetical protein
LRDTVRRADHLVLVAVLLLATPAVAGVIDSPFSDPAICTGVTFNVVDTLPFTDSYIGAHQCASVCKKVVSDCKKFVRRIHSCMTDFFSTNAAYDTRNCSETESGLAVGACKLVIKANLKGTKVGLTLARDAAFGDCEIWGAACQSECAGN